MSDESSKYFRLAISADSLNKHFSKIIPVGTQIPDSFIVKSSPTIDNNELFDSPLLSDNTVIPSDVAYWMENLVETYISQYGLNYNRGKGNDIDYLGVEFKTRIKESTSHHTIGTTTLEDIINHQWNDSFLKEKIQLQYRVTWSKTHLCVTESRVYDFRNKTTQEAIETAYTAARNTICDYVSNGGIHRGTTYIKANECIAHFQLKSGRYNSKGLMTSGTFQFRINHSYMKTMIDRALTGNIMDKKELFLPV